MKCPDEGLLLHKNMICEVIVDIAHSEVDKIFDYTCDFPVAAGTRVAVPFGKSAATGFVMRVKDTSDYPVEKLKKVYRAEEDFPALGAECLALAHAIAARYRVPMALVLRLFLPAEMRTGRVGETYRTFARLIADIPPAKNAPQQAACIAFLQENGEADAAVLRKMFGSAVNALVKKGAIALEKRRILRDPYRGVEGESSARTLTPAQDAAVRRIEETDKTVTLLHGVTGSGKTEIYLTLIAKALARGQTAIFLVPEISLTPQMLSQLRARFGAAAAILHSGLSAGERFDEWHRLREGTARIAIGARSAIFAPVENVGVIVIDEEHDGSYLSESAPRYNTFDVALLRAQYNHCKLVLGSATPSVETYRRAKDGEFELITLPDRINARPLPATAAMSPSASTATWHSPSTARRIASNVTTAAHAIKCSPPAPNAAPRTSITRARARSAWWANSKNSILLRAFCAWTTIRRAAKRDITAS